MAKSFTIGYKALKLFMLILFLSSAVIAQSTGSIKGTVKDSGNDDVLIGANVFLPNAQTGASTDINGEYIITNIPAGKYEVIARYVGYKEQTVEIVIKEGKSTQLDFFLDPTAVQLDELVVTGVGSAIEKRKLTATVETISKEEIRNAPVETVDQLLQGRVTGLSSFNSSGMPGTAGRISTRGIKSVATSTTPVIYVDGVRVDNNMGTRIGNDTGGNETSSLADLVTGEIERVEFIKGGAASTLYGSEAANGVIQIFTKKGYPGKPKWTFQATTGFDQPDTKFITEDFTKDEVLQTGTYQAYNVGVSGGNEFLTYTFNSKLSENKGIFRNDKANHKLYNLSAGFRVKVDETKNLEISSSYTKSIFSRPFNNNSSGAPYGASEQGDWETNWSEGRPYTKAEKLAKLEEALTPESGDDINRFRLAVNFDWKPIEDFTNKFTFGIDYRKNEDRLFIPKWNGDYWGTENGSLDRADREYTTLTFGYNGSYKVPEIFGLEQNINFGFQGYRVDDRETFGEGSNFEIPGTDDFDNAAEIDAGESNRELYSYGFYFTDMIGITENLFFDAGFRIDGNSTFGDEIGLQFYPKVGFAYNISDEDFFPVAVKSYVSTLKLRTAWGQTGNFPAPFTRDRTYASNSYLDKAGLSFGNRGNDDIKPEKTSSLDAGFDMGLFNDMIYVEFNYFNQKTLDALFRMPQDPTSGFNTQLTNVGEIENKGIELAVSAQLYSSQNFTVSAKGSYSTLSNKIVSLGGSSPFSLSSFTFLPRRVEEGHTVGVYQLRVPSANGSVVKLMGNPTPTDFGSFGLNATIFRNLTVSTLLEYAYGHNTVNLKKVLRYFNGMPDTEGIIPDGYNWQTATDTWLEDADWIKLREIALSYRFPKSIFEGLSLSFAVRNVAVLYSASEDNDPELNGFDGSVVGGYTYTDVSAPRQFRLSLKLSL